MLLDTGVDACTFGGTKNGLMFGEAIVFPRYHPAIDMLASSVNPVCNWHRRCASWPSQFEAILSDDLWLANASHANGMARLLAERVAPATRGPHRLSRRRERRVCVLPPAAIEPLQARASLLRVGRCRIDRPLDGVIRHDRRRRGKLRPQRARTLPDGLPSGYSKGPEARGRM